MEIENWVSSHPYIESKLHYAIVFLIHIVNGIFIVTQSIDNFQEGKRLQRLRYVSCWGWRYESTAAWCSSRNFHDDFKLYKNKIFDMKSVPFEYFKFSTWKFLF